MAIRLPSIMDRPRSNHDEAKNSPHMQNYYPKLLADIVNPILLILFLAILASRPWNLQRTGCYLLGSAMALLVTFMLAHANRWMSLWKAHPHFPSGHMSFYVTVATWLFFLNRRTSAFTLPLGILYGWLVVHLGFHEWLDLTGAVLLAIPVSVVCRSVACERRGCRINCGDVARIPDKEP